MSDFVRVTEAGCDTVQQRIEELFSRVVPSDVALPVCEGRISFFNDGTIEVNFGSVSERLYPGTDFHLQVTHQGEKRDILLVRYLSPWMPMGVKVTP